MEDPLRHRHHHDNLDHLCDDVILLVLSLLPPKASARFKSVCSDWNRLITNSSYLRSLHKCRVDHKRVEGFYHGSKVRQILRFGLLMQCGKVIGGALEEQHGINNYGLRVSATCDGFFLLDYPFELILRNPVAKISIKIPVPPPALLSTRLNYFGLTVSSLCKKERENKLDFEIMSITIGKELAASLCFIYSSSAGSWMTVKLHELVFQQLSHPQNNIVNRHDSPWAPYPALNPVGSAFLKRSLHWLLDDRRIFAFDLKERTW